MSNKYSTGSCAGSIAPTQIHKTPPGSHHRTQRSLIAFYFVLALSVFRLLALSTFPASYVQNTRQEIVCSEVPARTMSNSLWVPDSKSYTPDFDPDVDDIKWEGLHILRSRYQQGQPQFVTLGWARLALFRDFCLPSVIGQTTDNFIWLIYADPDLDGDLLDATIQLLRPYRRFFLIKSLSNVLWKGGQPAAIGNGTVYTGDRKLLEYSMARRNHVPILETRLDADDGLHKSMLEDIQKRAIKAFYK